MLFGDRSGSFPRRQDIIFPYYAHVESSADLDGDGHCEVARGSSAKPQVGIISGSRLDLAYRPMLLATPEMPGIVLAGDLDNDGLVDLLR